MNSGRTLVLCFDGTSNKYEAENTNIPLLFSLLKKDTEQLCYYQAGIGTWFSPGVVSPIFEGAAKILDLAFAWYLDAHVLDGYKFIMNNWKIGDKICLFGFSRGAYTARVLAGVLNKVGLLPKGNDAQVPFAYKLYTRTDQKGIELCRGFKQTYCTDVKIDFVGVWETVGSVGLITHRCLPFVNENDSIKTFRHALSLDEHRSRFQPNHYHCCTKGSTKTVTNMTVKSTSGGASAMSARKSNPASSDSGVESDWNDDDTLHSSFFRPRPQKPINTDKVESDSTPADVLEVWFSGCHSDVGGGSVPNDTPHDLAYITLRWMLREIVKSRCGIRFNVDALDRACISLAFEDITIRAEDFQDALQPIYDTLKTQPPWWILEFLPTRFTWEDADGRWKSKFGMHLGRGREIQSEQPVFHTSVRTRMDVLSEYKPRAKWTPGTEIYVS